MNGNVVILAAGLGLVLLTLAVLVVVRRRGAAPAEAGDAVPAVDLGDLVQHSDPAEPTGATALDASPGAAEVRALRAHVRVLEEALQRAADATVEQPELADHRAQVRVAVEAVARRTTPDGDPRAAVARVAAAIARLDADPAARTLLPAPLPRPMAVVPAAPEPAPEPAAVETAEAPDTVEAPVAVEEEVVLPVPPPAPAQSRRSKRRLRRSAA